MYQKVNFYRVYQPLYEEDYNNAKFCMTVLVIIALLAAFAWHLIFYLINPKVSIQNLNSPSSYDEVMSGGGDQFGAYSCNCLSVNIPNSMLFSQLYSYNQINDLCAAIGFPSTTAGTNAYFEYLACRHSLIQTLDTFTFGSLNSPVLADNNSINNFIYSSHAQNVYIALSGVKTGNDFRTTFLTDLDTIGLLDENDISLDDAKGEIDPEVSSASDTLNAMITILIDSTSQVVLGYAQFNYSAYFSACAPKDCRRQVPYSPFATFLDSLSFVGGLVSILTLVGAVLLLVFREIAEKFPDFPGFGWATSREWRNNSKAEDKQPAIPDKGNNDIDMSVSVEDQK